MPGIKYNIKYFNINHKLKYLHIIYTQMSYNINLNSSNAVGINNNTYQYNFIQGSFDVPEGSEIQLASATVPYSMQNITSALGNNSFAY